jgi:hypothetical protein
MVEEGKPAPTFMLPNAAGGNVALESFRERAVVLYLPRADSLPPFYRRSSGPTRRSPWSGHDRP